MKEVAILTLVLVIGCVYATSKDPTAEQYLAVDSAVDSDNSERVARSPEPEPCCGGYGGYGGYGGFPGGGYGGYGGFPGGYGHRHFGGFGHRHGFGGYGRGFGGYGGYPFFG